MNRNVLKIIAAVSMFLDHLGYEIFPNIAIFHIIGRLAFPIFAYFIFEGSKYTRHKGRYLSRILGLGLVCVLAFYVYSGEIYGNVLITFSLSIVIIFAILNVKQKMESDCGWGTVLISWVGMVGSVLLAYVICRFSTVDYGFIGVLVPVFPCVTLWDKSENKWRPILAFGVGLLLLSINMGGAQYFSLLSLLLLLLYNHEKGKSSFKWWFYIFYPAHLLLIGVISELL